MRLVAGHDAMLAQWVAMRIPQVGRGADFGPCTAIGVVDAAGELAGAVVFHGFQPRYRSIDVSFAAESARWLSRPILTAIMGYPFEQLQVRRIGTWTPKRNRRARDFVERFGFKREGLIRKGFGDDDAVVSGMLASEWQQSCFNLAGSRSRNPAWEPAILRPGP